MSRPGPEIRVTTAKPRVANVILTPVNLASPKPIRDSQWILHIPVKCTFCGNIYIHWHPKLICTSPLQKVKFTYTSHFLFKSTMHIQIQCMWSLFTTKWIYSKCSQNLLNRSPPIYIHSFNPPGGTGLVSSVGGAVSEPLERPTGPVMSSITLWTRRFNNVYTILW